MFSEKNKESNYEITIQNYHLRRYIVGYTVGNSVFWLSMSVAVKLSTRISDDIPPKMKIFHRVSDYLPPQMKILNIIISPF